MKTDTISRDTIVRAIVAAKTLVQLRDALNAADLFAGEHGMDRQSIYDATALQVFSDTMPSDTANVYSYDDTQVLTYGVGPNQVEGYYIDERE